MNDEDDPKRKLSFDPTINLGHVLTFLGFMITAFVAWSTMDKRVALLEAAQLVQHQRDQAQDDQARDRMAELTGRLSSMDGKLDKLGDKIDQQIGARPAR